MCCYTFPGCLDYAGFAADPRTDRHVATRAETEYPDTKGTDSEDSRRPLKTTLFVSFSFVLKLVIMIKLQALTFK